MGTMFFAGNLISSIVMLPLSDRLGRKTVMMTAFYMHLVFLLGSVFLEGLTGYWIFVGLNLFTGLAAAGYFIVPFYMNLESIQKDKVVAISTLFRFVSSLSPLMTAFYFYFVSRDWRYFFLFLFVVMTAVTLFAQFYLVESPRFLFSMGRTRKGLESINSIA